MVKNSVLESVKETLESLNVCVRCVLRFLGVKEYTSYTTKSNVEKAIQKLINCQNEELVSEETKQNSLTPAADEIYPPFKKYFPSPCSLCLGILQDNCDEMLTKIQGAIAESGHLFDDFVIQLSIPVAVDLRDKLFLSIFERKIWVSNLFLLAPQLSHLFSRSSYTFSDCEIPSVKDVWKWVIGSQLGKISNTDFTPYSDFQISVSATYPDTAKECLILFQKCPEAFPNRKKRKANSEDIYTRTAVLKAMELLSSEIRNLYPLPPSTPDKSCTFEKIKCTHSPLYLGGRYNKYSRELSQTPWFVDGERRMDSSVNELITDVVQKKILADKIIFSSSGREDVDVKMLGNGRPFVLEVLNPRKMKWSAAEITAIENEINSCTNLISVKDLQTISKQDTLLLKEGEEHKRKTYSALCLVEKTLCEEDVNKLELLKDLKLQQKTPIRVLHRRTLATREKLLHSMEAKILSDHRLQLKLETQAGTYVKEFVHGDFGRTVPNLGTLLDTQADILELDVESIHLDWPPKSS